MNKEVKEYAIEKTKELIGTPTRGGNGRGERGNETIYSGTGYPEFMKTALFIMEQERELPYFCWEMRMTHRA